MRVISKTDGPECRHCPESSRERLLSKITGVFSGLLVARVRDAESSGAFVDSHQKDRMKSLQVDSNPSAGTRLIATFKIAHANHA